MENYLHTWETHFTEHRPFLIAFCFRMTGSLAEAEDMVQDAFIACAETDPKTVTNHRSWLTKVCANKSLDLLKSAAKRRETYPGVWLPDAIPDSFGLWGDQEGSVAPDKKLLNRESFSTSALILLQKLTPEERVTYLLADIFDYTFVEIGLILKKSEDACKKIAQRARKAFENEKRFVAYSDESKRVIEKFYEIAKTGDAAMLESLLAPGAEFWPDGGGKASVASQTLVVDLARVAKFFAGLFSSKLLFSPDVKLEFAPINGKNGLVVTRKTTEGQWAFDTLLMFEVEDGKIARIYAEKPR